VDLDRISDVDVLRTLLKAQLKESERLKAELKKAYERLRDKDEGQAQQLALRLAEVERQHAQALKALFGPSSERRPKSDSSKSREREPQTGHGPKAQLKLPVEDVYHPAVDMRGECGVCGSALVEWKDQYEESEEIDFVAPQLVLKRHFRQKYRCTCGACVRTAPGPRKLFPKARYSINFALHVAMQKYVYHMPLARQVKSFGHSGLSVTTATLWDYLSALFGLLEPAMERLEEYVLSQPVMGMDETRWKLLGSDAAGKSMTWWIWVRRVCNAVHYTLDPSRSNAVAIRLLKDFAGTVIVDGYRPYEVAQLANPKIQLAHCWSHARREVLPFEADPRGARVLRVIQRLYRLEAVAAERQLSPPELLALRQRKTKPLLEALFKWLATLAIPSTYDLSKALKYILSRKQGLMRFVDDPLLSPDNNGTERVIRGVVVGRKNHYGSRSKQGTKVAALMYSLLDSAELAGLDPAVYLDAAVQAALDGEVIPLPHELAEERRAAS
jgi:transposase